MRDKLVVIAFLIVAALLIYVGRGMLLESDLATWGLTFAGTTAVGVLGVSLYRVQLELRASRRELARKQAELNFAHEVQRALFPSQFPQGKGLEFSGVCLPASGISGDYFDVIELSNGRVIFAIADISGKGISAAILMSNLHAVLRTLASSGRQPAELCKDLNVHLHQVTRGLRYATFFYAEWDNQTKTLRYINAGHNAPILITAQGSHRLAAGGPPVGIFGRMDYPQSSVTLNAGDTLVLFSDGVTEAGQAKDNEFGESRLEKMITDARTQPLAEIEKQVLSALRSWAGEELEDDMTLLLVRATKSAEEEG